MRMPYIGFVTIQVVLLAITMVYIRRTVSSVSLHVSKSMPITYVFMRFIAAFLAQLVNVFPAQILLISPSTANNAIFFRLVIVTHLLGSLLDALVLIFSNKEFMDWSIEKGKRFLAFIRSERFSPDNMCEKEPEGKGKERKRDENVDISENNNNNYKGREGGSPAVMITKEDLMAKMEKGESFKLQLSEGSCNLSCCTCLRLDFFGTFGLD